MRNVSLTAAALLAAIPAWSQEPPEVRLRLQHQPGVAIADPVAVAFAPQGATFRFLAAERGFSGRVVRNAPYSGEGVTEFTQTLADGTRIKRQSSSKFARDSEGRTRYEHTLGSIGPWAAAGEPPTMINIHDPAAGVTYILNDKDKTARRMQAMILDRPAPAPGMHVSSVRVRSRSGETEDVLVERQIALAAQPGVPVPAPPALGGHVAMLRSAQDARTESLGKQNIEGLVCEGTRVTHTIPAGQIGNDRPIETVTERWYSPELQTVVMTRTSDPMSGESVYRLTNVSRSEPDKSLFQVPPGYTVQEAGEFHRVIEDTPRR